MAGFKSDIYNILCFLWWYASWIVVSKDENDWWVENIEYKHSNTTLATFRLENKDDNEDEHALFPKFSF